MDEMVIQPMEEKVSGQQGLYRRGTAYRFKRLVKRVWIRRQFGPVSEAEAVSRATRLNLDIADVIRTGTDLNMLATAPKTEQPTPSSDAPLGQSATFIQFVEIWLAKKSDKATKATVRRYRAVADNFNSYLTARHLNSHPLSAIAYSVCDDYVTHRRTKPIFPNGYRALRGRVYRRAGTAHLGCRLPCAMLAGTLYCCPCLGLTGAGAGAGIGIVALQGLMSQSQPFGCFCQNER